MIFSWPSLQDRTDPSRPAYPAAFLCLRRPDSFPRYGVPLDTVKITVRVVLHQIHLGFRLGLCLPFPSRSLSRSRSTSPPPSAAPSPCLRIRRHLIRRLHRLTGTPAADTGGIQYQSHSHKRRQPAIILRFRCLSCARFIFARRRRARLSLSCAFVPCLF